MNPIVIPLTHNYMAVFLTFACNLKCSYCINHFEAGVISRKIIPGAQWLEGLNRIVSRPDLPLTLQGGEPSLHPDFIYIINHLRKDLPIDILTNLQFNISEFIDKVEPRRLTRDALYASIRVSYHPETMDLDDLIKRTKRLLEAGFSVGIWSVMHPKYGKIINEAQSRCRDLGIDFRLKEFLGEHEEKLHGTYRYEGACDKKFKKKVLCRTTEFLMDSEGKVYRCHADLYSGVDSIGSIFDSGFQVDNKFRECDHFGHCNPCDVKVKTNRFQQFGHTSVEVKFI